MKLFIYEKFWNSLSKLNKHTQVRVIDFMSKIRENPRSGSIHLESIHIFKDISLRTARIDQKYRAVLKEVEAGNTYLLVWVDNHDEAMNWAKNKFIDWNNHTQSFQLYTIDDSIVTPETVADTVEKEKLFNNRYGEKELLKLGVPPALMPSVLAIQDISQLEAVEQFLPEDVFENLFYLLDGADIQAIITEINEGTIASTNHEEQLRSRNNIRSFIELTDDELFNEALQGSLKKWKHYLHPSQSEYVNDDFKGSIKISGGAGTGKTVVALHRLRYLSKNRRSEKPILFTTFTKELTENLKGLAVELGANNSAYIVENIDALAFRLAKERELIRQTDKVFGLSSSKEPQHIWEQVLEAHLAPFDEEFLQEEYEQVILEQAIQSKEAYLCANRAGRGKPIGRKERLLIWELFERFNQLKAEASIFYKEEVYNLIVSSLSDSGETIFSHIIVDEIQDFSNVELRFLRSLTPEGENDLFLVGDPLQNIYNKKINFTKAGIHIRGKRSKRLRLNYRTTEEIKNLAVKVIAGEEFDDFNGGVEEKAGYLSLFHGIAPEYTTYHSKDEELEAVVSEIDQLIDAGYQYSDIAIVARMKNAVDDFRNYLHKRDIPYANKNLLSANNEGVRLATFHGIKGLEFKHVFLVDVNENTFPRKSHDFHTLKEEEQAVLIRTERSLFYVACSRAVERVMISGIGARSELLLFSNHT